MRGCQSGYHEAQRLCNTSKVILFNPRRNIFKLGLWFLKVFNIIDLSRVFCRLKIVAIEDKAVLVRNSYGPIKHAMLPLERDENVACLAGMIVGDGHLTKNITRIHFEVTDMTLLRLFVCLIKSCFHIEPRIKHLVDKRKNRKKRYAVSINSVPLYLFFNMILEIPRGKKNDTVKAPRCLFNASPSVRNAFLIGVLLTDGGNRRRGYGISSASKDLRDDVCKLLIEHKVKCYSEEWINLRYKKRYYGLYFNKKEIAKIMRECQSGQMDQILQKFSNDFAEGLA